MSSAAKLHSPVLELEPLQLYRYRQTLFEMLQDSGFRVDIQWDKRLPLESTPKEFIEHLQVLKQEQQLIEIQDKQTQQEEKLDENLPDPLSLIKNTEQCQLKEMDIKTHYKNLQQLNILMEWSLFIYAKQASTHISNSPHAIGNFFMNFLDRWRVIKENNHPDHSDSTEYVPPPKDILIVFCKQESVLQKAYEAFKDYLLWHNVSDGVLVSQNGSSPTVFNLSIAHDAHDKQPTIRVIPFADELFYNKNRYNNDIPLARRLSRQELALCEKRYGKRQFMQKLLKSQPLCQYYGFRIGDVIWCMTAPKRIKNPDLQFNYNNHSSENANNSSTELLENCFVYANIQEQIEADNSHIQTAEFRLVVRE